MDWHAKSMPLPKEFDPSDCTNFIRDLNGTDGAQLNKYPYNVSFIYFDGLSFQVETERNKLHSL